MLNDLRYCYVYYFACNTYYIAILHRITYYIERAYKNKIQKLRNMYILFKECIYLFLALHI